MIDRADPDAQNPSGAGEGADPASADAFRLLVETIPQLVWRARGIGEWTWSSRQWQTFTGQSAAQARARGWLAAVHPDDRDRTLRAWEEAEARGRLDVEHRLHRASPEGYRWFETRALPLRDADGAVREWFGTATDIHDLKMLQQQQAHLLAELQHRVRNALATVRVIARRSSDTSESVEDYAMHLDGRLNAVSRVQSAIIRNPVGGISLPLILSDELFVYHAHEGEDFTLDGPPVFVQPRAAERLALAFHELATNAVKFGALARPEGSIAVAWRIEPPAGGLSIAWTETGLALGGPETRRRGFGLSVLEQMLPHDLRADVDVAFHPGGLTCRMRLPPETLVPADEDPTAGAPRAGATA